MPPGDSIAASGQMGTSTSEKEFYLTVKLIDDRTLPASSVTSTRQSPGLMDLRLQVRVELNFRSSGNSNTFLSPKYHRCLIVAGTEAVLTLVQQ